MKDWEDDEQVDGVHIEAGLIAAMIVIAALSLIA